MIDNFSIKLAQFTKTEPKCKFFYSTGKSLILYPFTKLEVRNVLSRHFHVSKWRGQFTLL